MKYMMLMMILPESCQMFTAYDRALEISNTDKDSSQIHAVLGMVAYKFGDVDGAKSSLFQRSDIDLKF